MRDPRMTGATALLAFGMAAATLGGAPEASAAGTSTCQSAVVVTRLAPGTVVQMTALQSGWVLGGEGRSLTTTAGADGRITQPAVPSADVPAPQRCGTVGVALRIVTVPADGHWPTGVQPFELSSASSEAGTSGVSLYRATYDAPMHPQTAVRLADLRHHRVQVRVRPAVEQLDTSAHVTLAKWPGRARHCGRITPAQWRSSEAEVVAERDLPLVPQVQMRWTVKTESRGCMAVIVDGSTGSDVGTQGLWATVSLGVRVR